MYTIVNQVLTNPENLFDRYINPANREHYYENQLSFTDRVDWEDELYNEIQNNPRIFVELRRLMNHPETFKISGIIPENEFDDIRVGLKGDISRLPSKMFKKAYKEALYKVLEPFTLDEHGEPLKVFPFVTIDGVSRYPADADPYCPTGYAVEDTYCPTGTPDPRGVYSDGSRIHSHVFKLRPVALKARLWDTIETNYRYSTRMPSNLIPHDPSVAYMGEVVTFTDFQGEIREKLYKFSYKAKTPRLEILITDPSEEGSVIVESTKGLATCQNCGAVKEHSLR